MSRPHEDQVIDDEEEDCCPLCIEELDPSDKVFFPCPCGFQVCAFCHKKLKEEGNGLCPNCRRRYDDKNIRIEQLSPDEFAKYRAKQARKKTAPKQKETPIREADPLSRKHLAGIRVRRQNLVYVTGLRLNTSDPQLSEKLRGEQFFGQYGKIDKIVVNKPKDSRSLQSVGVYITYFEKDAAALCISMVNGTQNAGVTIRADYGTTKYCSAYLRGENCTNRNCTFLHEPGEENESFTREDLSALNAKNIEAGTSANPAAHTQTQPPPRAPSIPPSSLATVAHLMERQESRDGTASPVESNDGSALPSTVSWANRAFISRPASQAPSVVAPSPMVSSAIPVPSESVTLPSEDNPSPKDQSIVKSTNGEVTQVAPVQQRKTRTTRDISPMSKEIRDSIATDSLSFVFNEAIFAEESDGRSLKFLRSFPPLFDSNGGAKRQLMKTKEMERLRLENDQRVAAQALSAMDIVETIEGGSLQLGGEPEEQVISSTIGQPLPPAPGLSNSGGLSQQQYLQEPQPSHANSSGHTRQTSRFSFANDSASSTTSVKPVGNPKLMSQQSSMMPSQPVMQPNPLTHNQLGGQFYASNVQGPPPGLKPTRTPSVSGGGMFGQGHGFATASLGYDFNQSGRTINDEMMRDLLRNRGGSAASARGSDSGRHDLSDPNMIQARMHQGIGVGQGTYGAQGQNQGQGGFNSMMYNNSTYGRW